jgi:hypothetical protein
MSRGLEILRRLLLAAGALAAAIGFIAGATFVATGSTGDDQVGGLVGMIFAPLAFWGYRAAINWILVYEKPEHPDAEF